MSENDSEEVQNIAVKNLKDFIHAKTKTISFEKNEKDELHLLEDKLYSAQTMFYHLDEQLQQKYRSKRLIDLNQIIFESIQEILMYLEEEELEELRFAKEDRRHLAQLSEHMPHKEWKLVFKEEVENENKEIRAEKTHLKELHHKFRELKNEMQDNNYKKILQKEEEVSEEIKIEIKKILHYFDQIREFLQTYEHIFHHLLKKEEHISKKENHYLRKVS